MEIKLIIIMLISIWYTYSWIKGQKLFFLSLLPKVNKYINLVFGPFLPNGNSYWIQQIYTRSTYPICTSVQRILISVWVIVKIHQIIFFSSKSDHRVCSRDCIKVIFIVSPSQNLAYYGINAHAFWCRRINL